LATEVASLFARVGADITGLTAGLAGARNALTGAGQSMQSAGMALTMGLTLPLVGLGVAAAKAASDLDTQMHNIQSIAGLPAAELDALRQRFIDMSTDASITRDSASKLAEGFYFIQSSGFAGAEGITVLLAATKAASAGLTTTEVASKAILAALNAYGMGAEDATTVSDILFRTVDLGVMTFEDLASQLGDVVNTSSITGQGLDVVGAALAQMTRKGISSAESVTALNQLLLQFISPSQKMMDTAEGMGVELSVASLRSKGLAGALQEIMDKGGGPNALLTLFGDNVRALKGALALGGDGLEGFMSLLGEFEDITGRTNEAFAEQMKSFSAQWDNFKNVGTAALITLGTIFLPVLMDFLKNGVQPLLESLRTMNPEWLKWGLVIAGVLIVLGPALMILGTLVTVLGFLVSPIGLVIAAIVALGVAFATNTGGIRDAVMPILQQLWTWLQVSLPLAIQTLTTFWTGTLLPALQSVWTWVQTTVFPIITNLWTWLQVSLPLAIQTLTTFWTGTLLPALQSVWTWMSTILFPFFTALADFLSAVFGKAVEALAGLWQNVLLPALRAVWSFLKVNVFPIFQAIGEYLEKTLRPILDGLSGFITGTLIPIALTPLAAAFLAIEQAIKDATTWLSTMADKIRNLELPGWLTPGSPTPFEMGLRGIAAALKEVSGVGLPSFNSNLSHAGASGMARGGNESGGAGLITNYYVTINDKAAAALWVERERHEKLKRAEALM